MTKKPTYEEKLVSTFLAAARARSTAEGALEVYFFRRARACKTEEALRALIKRVPGDSIVSVFLLDHLRQRFPREKAPG